ncbi:hypothetical protein SLNSH_18210 [Alsobacter soli]|uniref:Uncharacterized protein n=1 Tax=Alsobacter soli TaxID=2109933 RepID=A0A2T1HPL6_9HYPH|nr:hypothetical protein [Alsobacter soli]PSC03576.1 hypothetical protein SLNSH_18210 [Alsobacter soli]
MAKAPGRQEEERESKPGEAKPAPMDPVQEADEESFPASDPPAWTGTTGAAAPDHPKPRKPRKD